jgi:hypothetical protein
MTSPSSPAAKPLGVPSPEEFFRDYRINIAHAHPDDWDPTDENAEACIRVRDAQWVAILAHLVHAIDNVTEYKCEAKFCTNAGHAVARRARRALDYLPADVLAAARAAAKPLGEP